MLKNLVKKNAYYDSATLMLISSKLAELAGGSENIAVMMASQMNKDIMRKSGLLDQEGQEAAPNDLIFAMRAESEEKIAEIEAAALDMLEAKSKKKSSSADKNEDEFESSNKALENLENIDLAVVSLPGQYAHTEVAKLLKHDVNVLLFSDNVSLEKEQELKDLALKRGLLMMGPDCGTAVINGLGLGFANSLNKGPVGLVAASGTGLQEVMCLLSNAGVGVSQALGTGGRDVKEDIAGRMLFQGLDLLEQDEQTRIVALVSKPPSKAVLEQLKKRLAEYSKPVVACLLGDKSQLLAEYCLQVDTLAACARAAAELMQKLDPSYKLSALSSQNLEETKQAIAQAATLLSDTQKYIRALYCGGTLSYETQLVIEDNLGAAWSNAPLNYDHKLTDPQISCEHTVLDLGDDAFTVGKPHPMIEPSLRSERLIKEALDPTCAVIMADIETGYGAHEKAGEILAADIRAARDACNKAGQTAPLFFVNICGSYSDFQNYDEQRRILEQAGAFVFENNELSALAAVSLIKSKQNSKSFELISAYELDEARLNSYAQSSFSSKPAQKSSPALELFKKDGQLTVLNLGLEHFNNEIKRQPARAVHVNWKPMAGGNLRLIEIIEKLQDMDEHDDC